jgi:ABC-type antimicrobial peptide transport system, ATPase component
MSRFDPSSAMTHPILLAEQVSKRYTEGPQAVEVLKDVNLRLDGGQTLAIIGASGRARARSCICWAGSTGPMAAACRSAGATGRR